MATAVRTSLLNNFSACWSRYMDTGKSSEFLKATLRLFPSSSAYYKDHIEIAKEVISGYSTSESVTPTAVPTSPVDENKAAKVALGCLKAVRALLRDKTPRTNVHIILAACTEVGRSVQNFGSTSNKAMIREEIERILAMSKVEDDGSERLSEEGVAQERARLVAPLVVSTLRIFPAIHSIAVDRQHVEGYLTALMEANAWPATVGLVKLYPQSISVSMAKALMSALVRAGEAEVSGELASFLYKVCLKQQSGSQPAASTSSGDWEQRCLPDITNDELLGMVWSLISSCLEADQAKSLNVALDVAQKLQLHEIAGQIRARQMKQKMNLHVKKGKWQLSFQVISRKTLEHKVCLYNCMVEQGLFIEAMDVYRQLKLQGHVTAVTEDQMAIQRRENEENYLSLPLPLKQVVMIDNLQSLKFAADMLGLSLEMDLSLVSSEHTTPMSLGDLAKLVLQEDGSLRRPDQLGASHLMGPYRLAVGLDAEWKASMFRNLDSKGCSILQIATTNQIFILDFRQICGELHSRHSSDTLLMQQARRFLSNLMRDETVLKVGWAFLDEDVRMLRNNAKGYFRSTVESIGSYVELNAGGAHILRLESAEADCTPSAETPLSSAEELFESDLDKKTQKIAEGTEEKVANENDELSGETDVSAVKDMSKKVNTRSLAGACSMFLGKPLLKTEQMSDWDRRPLSEPQLRYASLDAHATLALMDAMLTRMRLTDRTTDDLLGIASLYPGALSTTPSNMETAGK